MLAGRVLNVAQAKPQKEGTVLGSKVAVWEQVWSYPSWGCHERYTDLCIGELVGETRSQRGGPACCAEGERRGDGEGGD